VFLLIKPQEITVVSVQHNLDLHGDQNCAVVHFNIFHAQMYCRTHIGELLVPEPSAPEVELAIYKVKINNSLGIEQIAAELIKAGSRTICLGIHILITSIWKKEKLPEEWKESIIVPIHKKGDKNILIIIGAYHFCQQLTKFYPTSCSQG